MRARVLAPFAAALLAPALARAEERAFAPAEPAGLRVSVDAGGGVGVAAGPGASPVGVAEGELTLGYEAGAGFVPELSLLLGLAPGTYAGFRAGLHYDLPGTPWYLRGAIDVAGPGGSLAARWILAGAGVRLRLTGVLGGFAEVDSGVPLSSGAGVPLLGRAGVLFAF